MRWVLAATVLGLWAAPAPLAAQQAACCAGDTARATQMREWDRRLEAKLAKVDQTTGDTRVTALAEAMRELVVQRREMHEHMARTAPAPGGCPSGGMQGAGHGGHRMQGAGRMAECPMRGAGGSGASP